MVPNYYSYTHPQLLIATHLRQTSWQSVKGTNPAKLVKICNFGFQLKFDPWHPWLRNFNSGRIGTPKMGIQNPPNFPTSQIWLKFSNYMYVESRNKSIVFINILRFSFVIIFSSFIGNIDRNCAKKSSIHRKRRRKQNNFIEEKRFICCFFRQSHNKRTKHKCVYMTSYQCGT